MVFSDPNEERISRIVTTFVTEPPSLVDSVLPETVSRTSPHSMSTHPLWLALSREIGNLKLLDDLIRPREKLWRKC